MELIRHHRRQIQLPQFAIQLPLYIRFIIGLLLSVMVVVAGALALTRHMQTQTNPFSEFKDLFAGDIREVVLVRQFTCEAVNFYSTPRAISDYCETQLTHDMFSRISLGILGNSANEISFAVQENSLTIGDLAALWGKPEFTQYDDIIAAAWPNERVTAIALVPHAGRIGYFLPVVHVAFTRSGNPRWALLLMMDRLPMLCSDCRGL